MITMSLFEMYVVYFLIKNENKGVSDLKIVSISLVRDLSLEDSWRMRTKWQEKTYGSTLLHSIVFLKT